MKNEGNRRVLDVRLVSCRKGESEKPTGCEKSASLMIGIVGFLILSTISMLVYPGYDFWREPFSTLGMIMADGQSNILASTMFNISMILSGVMLFICFYTDFRKRKCLSIVNSAGMIMSMSISGIGLSPWDMLPVLHAGSVLFWLVTFSIILSAYSRSSYASGGWNNKSTFLVFALFVITLVYTIGMIYVALSGDGRLIITGVVLQKIIIYGMFTFFLSIYMGWM